MRQFGLPDSLFAKIEQALKTEGLAFSDAKSLASSVKRLSDFYIENPHASTPWEEPWTRAAYLAYYFPLNWARAEAVVTEGRRLGFFQGLESAVDFGSGLSPFEDLLASDISQFHCVEKSREAIALHERLVGMIPGGSVPQRIPVAYSETFREKRLKPKTLGIFSYVYTELKKFPDWGLTADALLIVEPSTRADGRRLQELRHELLAHGFFAWAPCTHQGGCPLLNHSKKDWCHDRVLLSGPPWYDSIEKHLPFKNNTITFSYLLMKKSPPPICEIGERSGRLVGDPLKEKGKTRQLFCGSEKREFLSWLKKEGPIPELHRGELFEVPKGAQKKSDEWRMPGRPEGEFSSWS